MEFYCLFFYHLCIIYINSFFWDTFVQLFANLEFQKFPTNNQTIPLLKAPPNFSYNNFFSDRLPPQDLANVGNQTQGVLL